MHIQTNILVSHRAFPPLRVQSLQATPNYHREGAPFHIALGHSAIVILLWGFVGVLQKLGTSRITADSLMIWLMTGYLIMLLWLLDEVGLSNLATQDISIGI